MTSKNRLVDDDRFIWSKNDVKVKRKKKSVNKAMGPGPATYPKGNLERVPGKQNWVDKTGGLPRYIERIASHLHYEKGKSIGHSIAIAVNAVKKMCATGDVNWPGKQSVNAGSRAAACKAVASWERKKAQARVSKADFGGKWSDEQFIDFLLEETDVEKRIKKGYRVPANMNVHEGLEGERVKADLRGKKDKKKKKNKKVISKAKNPFWDGDGLQGVGQPRNHLGRWTKLPGASVLKKIGVWELEDGTFGVFEDGKEVPVKTYKTKRAAMKYAAKEVELDKTPSRPDVVKMPAGDEIIFETDRGNKRSFKKMGDNAWQETTPRGVGIGGSQIRSQEQMRKAVENFNGKISTKKSNASGPGFKQAPSREWKPPQMMRRREMRQEQTARMRENAREEIRQGGGKSLPGGFKVGGRAYLQGIKNKNLLGRPVQIVGFEKGKFTVQPIGTRGGPLGRPVIVDQKMLSKDTPIGKRNVSEGEREKLSDKGKALPDGSYPIANEQDLKNAIQAFGRAKNPEKTKRHIVSCAKKMGKTSLLPESWNVSKNNSLEITDEEFEELAGELENFSKAADEKDENEFEFMVSGEIEKREDDKQLVFGWSSIAKRADGSEVVDKQGDVLDDIDQMEKVAYDFVLHSRDGGEMHVRKGVSTLVESFVSTPEKWAAMGIPEGTLPTGWWVGFKVNDKDVWDKVKKGHYRMFSVHGSGMRKALEE